MMKYYGYGGMKASQNTKLHIISDEGEVLCGVRSFWMEATYFELNNDGFLDNLRHLFPITDKRSNTCKRCLDKWKSLVNFDDKQ